MVQEVDLLLAREITEIGLERGDVAEAVVTTPKDGAAQARTSIRWMGIDGVDDENGAPISGYRISSSSGTDWSPAAPSP